jgi:uncharacterized repeat protein (TIGR02543 family)
MPHNNDEFNYVKIINEEDGESLEFGETPADDSASFKENDDRLRDEINDSNASNNENKAPEEKKKRESKENKSGKDGDDKSSGSSSSSSSLGMAGIATVVGAALVIVPTLSTLVGINLFLRATCHMKNMDVEATSLKYELELKDTDDTNFVITLENATYNQSQELVEGDNEGYFVDLNPNTAYNLTVADASNKNIKIYTDIVRTLNASGSAILSFDANNRSGSMNSIEVPTGSEYSLPTSIFVPFDDEYFGGWKVNGEGQVRQPGETIVINSDTTLVAAWTKFPTQESSTEASGTFFSYFPSQLSETISTVSLMNIDFQCSYVYYDSTLESLNYGTAGGFVSTSKPFGGTLNRVVFNTSANQAGDVDFTMKYSAIPIYQKDTEQGETHTMSPGSSYTFVCSNPDARYFCLSNSGSVEGIIASMEFIYNTPVIDNEFQIYFDANGGTGSFGPYPIRNVNQHALPEINEVGFTAPEGYEFAGWKIQGIDDLLQPGTIVGLSQDVTLIAQWQPIPEYTVTFVTDGGSSVDSQTVLKGDSAVEPDDPTKDTYVFDGWYIDDQATEPYDFSQAVTGNLTLTARWKPDVDFSMYINYIDTLSASPTNEISFKYTKDDQYEHYVDYSLELDGEGSDVITLAIGALDEADTFTTKTASISSETASALGNGIINYTMKGIKSSGDSYEIATGSLSMPRTQKDYCNSVYIGGTVLEADNSGKTFNIMSIGTEGGGSSSSTYYVPVRFDYADPNKSHGSYDWRLVYSVDGSTETNTTFSYSGGGTANVSISKNLFDESTKQATFARIYFKDEYGNQIGGTFENVTMQVLDARNVAGFQLPSSYIVNPSSNPRIRLSACGERGLNPDNLYENYTFTTLGVNEEGFAATLTFRLLSKGGTVVKEYVIDIAQALKAKATSSLTTTDVEFEFIDINTGVDKHAEFVEQSKRYVVDVTLTVTPLGATPFTCTSYESYSFR